MKIKHKLYLIALCPVDQKQDVYQVTVTTQKIVMIEEIIAVVNDFKGKKAYQEDICQELHRRLACKVKLIGWHSGVRTEVICQ